jgi:ribulose-5-phosphate 4-epimerase/fuculose-1-phosphate aldolase
METELREELCAQGAALAAQGHARGGSGNISARLASGGFLISPSGYALGSLQPDDLSLCDDEGRHRSGPPPSKELPLHLGLYRSRPQTGAVVHLHTPYATAWSMVDRVDPDNALPAVTPYAVMRLGAVALLPFAVPGDPVLGDWIAERASRHSAFLLANHGSVVAARTVKDAGFAAEELEETARLCLMLRTIPHHGLKLDEVQAIEARYGDRLR